MQHNDGQNPSILAVKLVAKLQRWYTSHLCERQKSGCTKERGKRGTNEILLSTEDRINAFSTLARRFSACPTVNFAQTRFARQQTCRDLSPRGDLLTPLCSSHVESRRWRALLARRTSRSKSQTPMFPSLLGNESARRLRDFLSPLLRWLGGSGRRIKLGGWAGVKGGSDFPYGWVPGVGIPSMRRSQRRATSGTIQAFHSRAAGLRDPDWPKYNLDTLMLLCVPPDNLAEQLDRNRPDWMHLREVKNVWGFFPPPPGWPHYIGSSDVCFFLFQSVILWLYIPSRLEVLLSNFKA